MFKFNLNLGSFFSDLPNKRWTWKVWVILIVIVIIAFAASNGDKVISFFNRGQVAHTIINSTLPDRHMNDEIIKELKKKLSLCTSDYIEVWNVLGDWEAYQFANEMKAYLQESGWKVYRFQNGVPTKPGISYECTNTGFVAQIGKNM